MTNRRVLLLFFASSVLLIAGCSYPTGPGVEVTFYGSMNASDSTFTADGVLQSEGGISDVDTFRNVTIHLYAEDRAHLASEELGDLGANAGRLNVSVSMALSTTPEYVIFNSPDFWRGDASVVYYERSGNDAPYVPREVGTRTELPVSLP